jgi:hypothetical protein
VMRLREFTLVPSASAAEDEGVVPEARGWNQQTVREQEEIDMNMNLPEMAHFAWLMKGRAIRPFEADEDAPFRDTLAYEALRDLETNQLSAAVERGGTHVGRLRVRWTHWKIDPVAVREGWYAKPSIG